MELPDPIAGRPSMITARADVVGSLLRPPAQPGMRVRLRHIAGLALAAGTLAFPRQTPAVEEEESFMDIVVDGKAVATIVIPDDPLQCVEYAARELVYHPLRVDRCDADRGARK